MFVRGISPYSLKYYEVFTTWSARFQRYASTYFHIEYHLIQISEEKTNHDLLISALVFFQHHNSPLPTSNFISLLLINYKSCVAIKNFFWHVNCLHFRCVFRYYTFKFGTPTWKTKHLVTPSISPLPLLS